MDTDVTTGPSVYIDGHISSDTGNSTLSLDVTPLSSKIDYQNKLILYGDILLFAILIFMSFKLAFRGLWK